MRTLPVILAGMVLFGTPAWAQVTVNPGALDALGKPAPPKRRAAPVRRAPSRPRAPEKRASPAPTAKPTAAPSAPAKPEQPAAPTQTAPTQTAPIQAVTPPALPAVPTVPPAIAAMPPPVAVPLAHPPPPPAVPVADDAPGAATRIDGGLRVTFGPDRFELNPSTAAALRAFGEGLSSQTATNITIYAYAAGSSDDPSTPRRLSLARALAARAALIEAGIPSPRIYPRALGPEGGSASPDRVDVVAGKSNPPPAPDHAG